MIAFGYKYRFNCNILKVFDEKRIQKVQCFSTKAHISATVDTKAETGRLYETNSMSAFFKVTRFY